MITGFLHIALVITELFHVTSTNKDPQEEVGISVWAHQFFSGHHDHLDWMDWLSLITNLAIAVGAFVYAIVQIRRFMRMLYEEMKDEELKDEELKGEDVKDGKCESDPRMNIFFNQSSFK